MNEIGTGDTKDREAVGASVVVMRIGVATVDIDVVGVGAIRVGSRRPIATLAADVVPAVGVDVAKVSAYKEVLKYLYKPWFIIIVTPVWAFL